MWTPAARSELARPSQPCATCLTDAERRIAQAFLPAPARCARPRRWPMRVLFDGVLHVLRTGCAWRHLPLDFPPWQTTLRWFLRLARSGAFERMAHALTMADRKRAGRDGSPTAAVVDAQAARSGGTGVAGRRGHDAAKRVVGRKRHAPKLRHRLLRPRRRNRAAQALGEAVMKRVLKRPSPQVGREFVVRRENEDLVAGLHSPGPRANLGATRGSGRRRSGRRASL